MIHLFTTNQHTHRPNALAHKPASWGKRLWASICITMLSTLVSLPANAQWKSYLAYSEPTEIERASGNMIYVLASEGLYSYDTSDQSLQTYDKINALSDCGIAHIAWCQKAKRLVIGDAKYNNDLLEANGNGVNMADDMNKTMTTDKTGNDNDEDGAEG